MLSLKHWSGDYASLDAEIRRRVEDQAVYAARVEGLLNDFEEPGDARRAALGKRYLDYLRERADAVVTTWEEGREVSKWPSLRPLEVPPGGSNPEQEDEAVRNWRHREAMPAMSADEKVELEGAITQCIREAVARTMAVTANKPMMRPALVGEFCTQLRRTVQHWGHGDRRRLAVLQLCDTKYWDAPGILFPTAWPSVTFQQGISGTSGYAAQVVLEGSKVNQLAMEARGDATAEQVVLACIEEMRQNNVKADKILAEAKVMELNNARTLEQLHDFAVKTEEDFTDAVEAQRRLMGLAAA